MSVLPEHGRGLCDIAVDRRIGIELKKDLSSKKQVDRLAGQLMVYKREYEDIIVVLVGKTNKNALELLRDRIDDLYKMNGYNFGLNRQRIEIIDKGSKERAFKKGQDMFGVDLPEIKLPEIDVPDLFSSPKKKNKRGKKKRK